MKKRREAEKGDLLCPEKIEVPPGGILCGGYCDVMKKIGNWCGSRRALLYKKSSKKTTGIKKKKRYHQEFWRKKAELVKVICHTGLKLPMSLEEDVRESKKKKRKRILHGNKTTPS